jgi:hypothetical protein
LKEFLLFAKYNSNKQFGKDEMGWSCSTNGETRNACRLLVGNPEVKRPLGRPRRGWVDNIRMYLVEVGCGDVDWIGLAKDRNRWRTLVNSVSNLFGFHEMLGNYLVASRVVLSSI